jgi:hypothetical protein
MSSTQAGVAADPHQEEIELAERLAGLVAPDDQRERMLLFGALANLTDSFARREQTDTLDLARSILKRGAEPLAASSRSLRRAAVAAPPAAPEDSLYSDPVFLANARKMISDRQRIVGGVPTSAYRDCVAIGDASGWCCSGTLVAANVVVTAGHCDAGGCRDRILIGDDVNEASARIIGVRDAESHPDYDPPQPTSDLCVLILEDDVEVEPRGLADSELLEDASSIRLAGYGNTDVDGSTGYGRRRMVDVPLASNDPKYGADPATEFVAGAPFLDRDSCNGDSGGPAYVHSGNDWYLIGATSRATESTFRRCGDGGIYTLIPAFTEWIKSVPGGRWQ